MNGAEAIPSLEAFDVFDVFDPQEPLRPGDPRYVECSVERGSADLLHTMERSIRLASGYTCQLLSGHRGCGKTTELFRLQRELRRSSPRRPHFVVYCEADKYLDLNDVEYTDVLLAVARQLWSDIKDQEKGIRVEPGRLVGFLEELSSILAANVVPRGVEFDTIIGKLSFEIKKNPSNREVVRAHLRPRATSFLEAVNEVIESASGELKQRGYAGIVVVVDNLDRMFRNVVPSTNRSSLDALFVDAGEYLRGLKCHTIYTLPPAVLYSPAGGKLSSLFGGPPRMLPMIPVSRRDGGPDERGLAKLDESVHRRLHVAGLRPEDAPCRPTWRGCHSTATEQ